MCDHMRRRGDGDDGGGDRLHLLLLHHHGACADHGSWLAFCAGDWTLSESMCVCGLVFGGFFFHSFVRLSHSDCITPEGDVLFVVMYCYVHVYMYVLSCGCISFILRRPLCVHWNHSVQIWKCHPTLEESICPLILGIDGAHWGRIDFSRMEL